MVRIGTPWRHPESGIFWFRKRVPKRLRERLGRSEVKFSLRTRDPALARVRNLHALAHIERSWSGVAEDQPAHNRKIKLLLIDDLHFAGHETVNSAEARDENRTRATKLRPLFDACAEEAELAPSTVKRWTVVIDRFREHLGHDDVARISRADVVAFKDALLGSISNVTVRDVYIAALKATFQYGVDHRFFELRLLEHALELVQQRLGQIAQHGTVAQLQKGFDRHAGS